MNKKFFIFLLSLFPQTLFSGAVEVGIVSSVGGKPVVIRAEKEFPLTEGSAIHEGDIIKSGPGGSVNILYDDNSMQSVNSDSQVLVDSVSGVNEGSSYFTLMYGTLKSVVGKRKDKQKYEIEAGDVSLGVRGTSLQVTLNGDQYELIVFEGNVEVRPVVNVEATGLDDDTDGDGDGSSDGSSTKDNSGDGSGGKTNAKSSGGQSGGKSIISVSAGETLGTGKTEALALSPAELLKVVEEVKEASVESVTSTNEAQARTSGDVASAVVQTIEQDVIQAVQAGEQTKSAAQASQSTDDLQEKGRSLLINLRPSVKSLVNKLEDIQ